MVPVVFVPVVTIVIVVVLVMVVLVASLVLHEVLHEPLDELGVLTVDHDLPPTLVAEAHDDHPSFTSLLAVVVFVVLVVVPVELLHLVLDPAEPLVQLLDHALDLAGLGPEFIPALVVVLEEGERSRGGCAGRNGRRAGDQGSDEREHGFGRGWSCESWPR